jgi:hypothetical protein
VDCERCWGACWGAFIVLMPRVWGGKEQTREVVDEISGGGLRRDTELA